MDVMERQQRVNEALNRIALLEAISDAACRELMSRKLHSDGYSEDGFPLDYPDIPDGLLKLVEAGVDTERERLIKRVGNHMLMAALQGQQIEVKMESPFAYPQDKAGIKEAVRPYFEKLAVQS